MSTLSRTHMASAAVAALVGFALLSPQQALACGGCFSPPGQQSNQLILQNAERVLFHQDPKTGRTVAWVEVRFSGLAEDFGWVLPLPKVPKISVGSSWVFDQLDQRHAPRFRTELDPGDENCRDWYSFCYGGDQGGRRQSSSDSGASGGFDAGAPSAAEDDKSGKVQVLEKAQAGPYDYEILASKDAAALLKWLNDHGYDTPQKALPIIESHLKKGDVFVAVKLQSTAGVDQIKPIVLEMEDGDPCVPLRLTSIAAADDMSVVVTLAGPGRAVPKNHLHVVINQAKLNWFQGGSNYGQVLAAAIDEAAGRAFVTEYAGPGDETQLLGAGQRMSSAPFALATDAASLAQALIESKLLLVDDSANLIEQHTGLAKLAGQQPLSYFGQLQSCGYAVGRRGQGSWCDKQLQLAGTLPVNGAALAAALEKEFIAPIHGISDLLAAAKTVTRLVMRISPEEMDRDPLFAFHASLPALSNELYATFKRVCSKGWYPADQTRLTLAGGGSWVFDGSIPGDFNGSGEIGNNASDPRLKAAPMASKIEVLDESGAPVAVHPTQIELVDQAIAGAIPGKGPALPAPLTLKPAVERWQRPQDDGPRTFVEARDDSMCTVIHVTKPWVTTAGAGGVPASAAIANGGCSAGPGAAASGGAAGLLLCCGLLILVRRRIVVG